MTIWILTDFWLTKLSIVWQKWVQLVCLVKFYTMQRYSPDLTNLLFRKYMFQLQACYNIRTGMRDMYVLPTFLQKKVYPAKHAEKHAGW